jgi:hypothetical protein
MNTWLAVLPSGCRVPGRAHVTDLAGIDIPESPLIDVLDDPAPHRPPLPCS